MEWYTISTLIIISVVILLFIGLPIAVALGLTCFIALIPVLGFQKTLFTVGLEFIHFWSSPTLVVVALFILIGELLRVSGSAADVFDFSAKWLRRLPGGLALVTIATCVIFATMSGSHTAAIVALSAICLPEMLKRGYSERLATGALGGGGGLAHLIPPSVLAVIYAGLAEISIGEQLIAGVLPGVLLASLYATVSVGWAIIFPSAAPREIEVTWKERIVVIKNAIVPIILVFTLLVSIYMGIATVTEAASLGTFVLLILVTLRKIGWKLFNEAILNTVRTVGFIMFLVVGAKLLAWVMSYYMIGQSFLQFLLSLELLPMAMIVAFMVMYLIMGMFIDSIGMIVITVPILLPVVQALGYDPLWYGVLLLVNFELATITPPYGLNLFVLKGAAPHISFKDIVIGCGIFSAADVVCLILILAFPQIALLLPYAMRQ